MLIVCVCVCVAFLCVGIIIRCVIKLKRTLRNIEAGNQNSPSDEDPNRLSSRSTARSGSGSRSSGYDADVSGSDEEQLQEPDSRYLSMIPEERLSQLEVPESNPAREVNADRIAGLEPDRAHRGE